MTKLEYEEAKIVCGGDMSDPRLESLYVDEILDA